MHQAQIADPNTITNIADLAVPLALHQAALRSKAVSVEVAPTLPTMAEFSRQYAVAVLEVCHGNKSRAARVLGINRRSLYRWLARKVG